jgi:hypothetical protein
LHHHSDHDRERRSGSIHDELVTDGFRDFFASSTDDPFKSNVTGAASAGGTRESETWLGTLAAVGP